jgi:glutamate 5-kinase
MNAVPIINENDSVSSSEIRFGDNDSLSAIVAGMVHADHLFLLTDVDALYTDNPRSNPDAKRIKVVTNIVELRKTVNVTSPGSAVGTGGMVTKLIAAELATSAGCSMIISIGTAPQKILTILDEIEVMDKDSSFEPSLGTHFTALKTPQQERYWWILNSLSTCGTLYIDDGICSV